MSLAILDSFENENPTVNTLKSYLEKKREEVSYFRLKDKTILPCRSCGSCAYKSPGKCVINDDIHEIMRGIASSNILIFFTPVRFGGYSSQLKKAVDRMMPIGIPFYIVKEGHLLHPMRYGDKALIGIGIIEENVPDQEENFKLLVANNALNMSFSYNKAVIFKHSDSLEIIENEISTLFGDILMPKSLA